MISMEGVVKTYGERTVLSEVSFEVADQEIFGLLGPSGAGKTTIINILTHQVRADAGRHSIGVPAHQTGLMLDKDGLWERLSAVQNLNIYADIFAIPHGDSVRALTRVGLADALHKPVGTLSKGMRQRVALARAIVHEPTVLFLDEPTSGLDPGTARGIHRLILELRERGAGVFLTTHNMDEAVRLCDRVALLHRGVIVEQGSPTAICQRHHAIRTVPDLEAVFCTLTGAELE